MSQSAFRNQRPGFRNYSPPYGDKATFDPKTPSEGVRPRGRFPSRKNGRAVGFWTMPEFRAIALLEAFPTIVSYEERPERVQFRDGGSWLAYVPHFAVRLADGDAIVELSTDGAPRNVRQAAVAGMARDHHAVRGVRYVELSHDVVRARPRWTEALTLMRYLSVEPTEMDVLTVKDILDHGPSAVRDVERTTGVGHARLFAMVRLGFVGMARPGPLSQSTVLMPGTLGARP